MRFVLARVLAAAALAVSGIVHLHLASRYGYPGTISGTTVFRVQGVVALLVAAALLVVRHRAVWLAAVAVGVASFVAVMLYRYVDVGAIGPLPDMHDATWRPFPEKLLSAVAEASVVGWWLLARPVNASVRLPGPVVRTAGRRSGAPRPDGS